MKLKSSIYLIITLISLIASLMTYAQSYKYRVWLSDKDTTQYSLQQPEKFLSESSIARRQRQGIAIDMSDIPVSDAHLRSIEQSGVRIVTTSRWMNTAVIALNDTTLLHKITSLPCVDSIKCVWKETSTDDTHNRRHAKMPLSSTHVTLANNGSSYGYAQQQIQLLNLDSLHAIGYKGNGMTIAVLDAGFYDIENSAYIHQDKIIGRYDLPHGVMNYKYETHGSEVLSCMAADVAGEYIGSAPEAQYWLFVTEDVDSEYPIEEDYWVAAAEIADSAGVDIINTSLAYTTFDDESMNYTQSQLDGESAFISQAAGIAAKKGMLVVIAAGNEFNKSWGKIGFPADAHGCMTVGSVNADGKHSSFSSSGYTTDGRVKPDVMSMGGSAYAISDDNYIKCASGTSYAAPIMCGALACLWQSHPEWGAAELIERVHQASSQYHHPDPLYGYGIPDIYAAYRAASGVDHTHHSPIEVHIVNKQLHILNDNHHARLLIYDSGGRCLFHRVVASDDVIDLSHLEAGLYIAVITYDSDFITQKLIITS